MLILSGDILAKELNDLSTYTDTKGRSVTIEIFYLGQVPESSKPIPHVFPNNQIGVIYRGHKFKSCTA